MTLDYFLVTFQSIMDLIFSGILSLAHYLVTVYGALVAFCVYTGYFPGQGARSNCTHQP